MHEIDGLMRHPNANKRQTTMFNWKKHVSVYPIINSLLSMFMLKIEWIDRHGINQCKFIPNPTRKILSSKIKYRQRKFTKNMSNRNSSVTICLD